MGYTDENGIYFPQLGEQAWGEEMNANLAKLSEAYAGHGKRFYVRTPVVEITNDPQVIDPLGDLSGYGKSLLPDLNNEANWDVLVDPEEWLAADGKSLNLPAGIYYWNAQEWPNTPLPTSGWSTVKFDTSYANFPDTYFGAPGYATLPATVSSGFSTPGAAGYMDWSTYLGTGYQVIVTGYLTLAEPKNVNLFINYNHGQETDVPMKGYWYFDIVRF